MMQEDPYARFRKPAAAPVVQQPVPLPTQPQPFPGAAPLQVRRNPAKVQQEQIAVNNDQRGANADARAAEAADLARQRAEIDRQQAEIKARTAEVEGGVETTAQGKTAAGHMQTLQINMDIIKDALKKDPNAAAPGFAEAAFGESLPAQFRGLVASPERNVVRQSYGPIIESAVYLATGAAANDPQVERLIEGLVPVYTDGPEELRAKAIRLQAEMAKADSIAGSAGILAREKIQEVRNLFPQLYGIDAQEVMNPFEKPSEQRFELSGDSERIPIPEPMQKELDAFLAQNPPGSMSVEKFNDFYGPLMQRYEFGGGENIQEQTKGFVDSYNAGKASSTIPSPSRPLEGMVEGGLAAAGADTGLVGDLYTGTAAAANSMTAGLPELFAGREGRDAFNRAQQAHPKSALTGDVIGSLAPSVAAVKGVSKLASPLIKEGLGREIASEVGGNAIYAGVRGANAAEPENRLEEGLTQAALGGGSALLARGAIQGSRGFMGENSRKALDSLGPQEFDIPAQRGALPADEITPPAYQGMTDDQLRAEAARAQRGLDAWEASNTTATNNAAARQALETEAAQVAKSNANRQEVYVRENFRSTNPGAIDAIRAEAAEKFPTDPALVMQSEEFAKRAGGLKDFSTKGLEAPEILTERINRIDGYLAQDATPRSGTVEGVDLTTMQRAGLGNAEEAISGLPGVHGAREGSVESFNRQNSGRVLARIGEKLPKDVRVGTDMNDYVNKKLSNAFNTLRPSIKGKVDQGFNNGVAALRKQATSSDERKALWQELESVLQRFRQPDGSFNGEGYKDFSTTLRRYAEEWGQSGTPASTVAKQDMSRVAEQLRKQGQALVGRANPAAGRRLKTLEGAWAHQARIEAASRGAAKGGRGVYAPDEYLNSIERLDTSKGKTAVARGKGFDQEYAQDAREVLGTKPGKKISIQGSALTAYALSSLGVPGAAVAGSAVLGYAPGVKRIIQAIIDGKLGATPKAVTKALEGSAAGRVILDSSDAKARQTVLTQLLRERHSN